MTTNTMQPWDDRQMTADLLATVQTLPRLPLAEAARTAPQCPGVYLQFWASDRSEIVDRIGLAARAVIPIYVGAAQQSVRSRLSRYIRSLAGLPNVDLDELHVAVMACHTSASALFAETCLLASPARGLLNGLGGWGSKVPGSRRTGQQASPVDALFAPGRRWTRSPTPIDEIRARCQVVAALAALDPDGPRWAQL